MDKKSFIFYVCIACMASCTQSKHEANYYATMQEVEDCLIPLDSVTTQNARYIQLFDDSTLTFYNQGNHDICVVNLNNGNTRKIAFAKEGPDAVGRVDAYYYSPEYSWLYYAWDKVLTRVDSTGKVIEKVKVPFANNDGSPFKYAVNPYPRDLNPYLVQGSRHILTGMDGVSEKGQNTGSTLIFNINNNSVITGNPYPELYGDKENLSKWSVFGYRVISYTLMPDGKMLVNFPASDSLYVYDIDNNTRMPVYAGYSKPTNISRGSYTDDSGMISHYLSQYSYLGVLYDSKNEVYYRIIRLPNEDFDINSDLRELEKHKRNAIIILNKGLEIIGEYILPEGSYYPAHSFVNSEGLHVNTESEDDDFMKFRVFKLNIDL